MKFPLLAISYGMMGAGLAAELSKKLQLDMFGFIAMCVLGSSAAVALLDLWMTMIVARLTMRDISAKITLIKGAKP
jgi:hypothetical protein